MYRYIGLKAVENKDKLKAQITVFAALAFILVITLVCTSIKSALATNLVTEIDMASRLSMDSAFAGYHRGLLDEFDILALDAEDVGAKLMWHYAQNNISGICGGDIEFISAEWEDTSSMVLKGGIGVEKQVTKYMNVGIFSDILQNMLDVEKETKKAEIVSGIANSMMECENVVAQSDALVYEVIELVEGIKTNDGGVVSSDGKAVATNDYFAKAIITEPLTKAIANINSDAVYSVVSGMETKYTNVYELMDNMLEFAEVYSGLSDKNGNDARVATQCEAGYKKAYEQLDCTIRAVIVKTSKAIEKLEEYNKKREECRMAYEACETTVDNQKDVLGEELTTSLNKDIADMKNTGQYTGAKICEAAFMLVGLKQNLTVLNKAKECVSGLADRLTKVGYDRLKEEVLKCKESFKGMGNKLLSFNYDYVTFGKGSGLKVIDTLKNTIANGLGGLVLADKEVSNCSISYTDLASLHKSTLTKKDGDFLDDAKTLLLINEYIMNRFPSATDSINAKTANAKTANDKKDNEETKLQWCELNYVIEYILCGKKSDKDNLNEVLLKLVAIREGMNFTYLMFDGDKKREAFTLATSLVGASGNAAVVKVAQYAILAVWALGESICDLQKMLDKEAVPFIKTADKWQLSLTNLLAMNFSVDADDGNKNSNKGVNEGGNYTTDKESLTDMYYEDYLRVLLMAQDATDKRFYMMDAMELRMMALGEKGFRLRDYIWSATGVFTYRYPDSAEYYIREISYSYV